MKITAWTVISNLLGSLFGGWVTYYLAIRAQNMPHAKAQPLGVTLAVFLFGFFMLTDYFRFLLIKRGVSETRASLLMICVLLFMIGGILALQNWL
jgi:hypothetical protein